MADTFTGSANVRGMSDSPRAEMTLQQTSKYSVVTACPLASCWTPGHSLEVYTCCQGSHQRKLLRWSAMAYFVDVKSYILHDTYGVSWGSLTPW